MVRVSDFSLLITNVSTLNETSPTRTRQVLTSEAQGGVFRYGTTGQNTVNLFTLAANAGLINTVDPTVAGVLSTIRAATGTTVTFQPLGTGGVFFRQPYSFSNVGQQRRRFLAARFDFILTKNHALDVIYNDQPFPLKC